MSLIPAAPGSITNAIDKGVTFLLGWSQPSVIPQFRFYRDRAYPKEGKWTPQSTSRRRVWRRRLFQSIGSPVSCQAMGRNLHERQVPPYGLGLRFPTSTPRSLRYDVWQNVRRMRSRMLSKLSVHRTLVLLKKVSLSVRNALFWVTQTSS